MVLSIHFSVYAQNNKTPKGSVNFASVKEEVPYNDFKCPHKAKRKKDKHGRVMVKGDKLPKNHDTFNAALIEKREHTLSFDVVLQEEYFSFDSLRLYFDNNQVSFSPEAQEEFNQYIEKTKTMLSQIGDNKGFVLYVQGFSSQIPTSFSSDKELENLNSDRSSIVGKTAIANNLGLTHARALFVINQMQEHLPGVEIRMNEKEDLRIGKIPWTEQHQKQLEYFTANKNTLAIDSLLAPFKADQYVSISSNISILRTIEHQDLKMYAISTLPRLVRNTSNGLMPINEALYVSESTYELIGENLVFKTSYERDAYLKEKGLELINSSFRGGDRWFVVSNEEEKQALSINDEEQKIEALLKLGIVHYHDKVIIKDLLIKDCVMNDRYNYRVLID